MRALREIDFRRKIKEAKTMDNFVYWVQELKNYMQWVAEAEKKYSKHFKVKIKFRDI